MPTPKRKLLLIACSNRKRRDKGLLPALERYDGVTYRVIRKAMREGYFPPNVDIKILSAKFGLIDAQTRIPYYDQRMDRERAGRLRSQVQSRLEKILISQKYAEVYIDLGKNYFVLLDTFVFPPDIVFYRIEGKIGIRLCKLKSWFVDSFIEE